MELFLAAARFIHYAAAHQAFGLAAFSLMSPPGLRAATRQPSSALARVSCVVLLLSALAWLMATAGSMGDGLSDTVNPNVIGTVLARTEFGAVWRIRLVLCALLLVASFTRLLEIEWLMAALAAAALGSLALVGHAAIDTGLLGAINRSSQVLHVMSSGFWLGALIPLLFCLFRYGDPTLAPHVDVVLRRFSGLGHFAVALLISTGVVNTLLVSGIDLDLGSPYWQLLLLKVAIAGTMCVLAIINRYVYVPRMPEGGPGTRDLARGTVMEIVLGAVILGIVAVIGIMPPR